MPAALRLPDGTVCRTGPYCRRHGNLHRLQKQVFDTYEAQQAATKTEEKKWMEDTAESRARTAAAQAKRKQYEETSKKRWKSSTEHNIDLHHEFTAEMRKRGSIYTPKPSPVLSPIDYRRRVNLYMFACGVLDTARYENIDRMGIETPLHNEVDGNWRERSEYEEIKPHVEAHYAEAYKKFLEEYSAKTDNFASVNDIKKELHYMMFFDSRHENWNDAIWMLEITTARTHTLQSQKTGHKDK